MFVVARVSKLLLPALAVLAMLGGRAHATEPVAGAPSEIKVNPEAEKAAAEVPLGMKARKTAEATLAGIAKNAKCAPEAIADPQFFADTAKAMRLYVHSEDASLIARNKKHVVMAYGTILTLLVVFVVMLLLKQRGLGGQIEALREDLERAERD